MLLTKTKNEKLKTNYHSHTNFCDGKNTAEEMALSAIEKHFDVLGLSSHSTYPCVSGDYVSMSDFDGYVNEVRRVAELFKDKIEILCGFEADYISDVCEPDRNVYKKFSPDYLIGSVHYIATEKGYMAVDDTAEKVQSDIAEFFGGDARKAVCVYFDTEREMIRHGGFDILGHCDLVRKRNGVLKLFDENDSWYRSEIRALADEIAHAGIIAEINTGAIYRRAMNDVYPSAELLSLLRERSVPVMINSDAHDCASLDYALDRAETAAIRSGYTETAVITHSKITMQKL